MSSHNKNQWLFYDSGDKRHHSKRGGASHWRCPGGAGGGGSAGTQGPQGPPGEDATIDDALFGRETVPFAAVPGTFTFGDQPADPPALWFGFAPVTVTDNFGGAAFVMNRMGALTALYVRLQGVVLPVAGGAVTISVWMQEIGDPDPMDMPPYTFEVQAGDSEVALDNLPPFPLMPGDRVSIGIAGPDGATMTIARISASIRV